MTIGREAADFFLSQILNYNTVDFLAVWTAVDRFTVARDRFTVATVRFIVTLIRFTVAAV